MNQKNKINAAISYFFLGELFLLAKNNPDFNDPYIVSHSKNAVKIHGIFLLIFLIYWIFISVYLNITIPIIGISINHIIYAVLFAVFAGLILRGAYKANNGIDAKEAGIKSNMFLSKEQNSDNLSETQIAQYILSNIPFLGIIIAARYPTDLNLYGEKISGISSILMLFFILTNHPELLSVFVIIYFGYVAFVSIYLIGYSKIIYYEFISKIPDLQTIYLYTKAIYYYVGDFIKLIFGKIDNLNFSDSYNKILIKEQKIFNIMSDNLTKNSVIISNKVIFIPILNIIYLPSYFISKNSKYTIAIIQGLIISIIFGLFLFFFPNNYNIQIILLPAIILGIANVDKNPFYKIPIIYDIYALLDLLTFGFFSKVKFIKQKQKEVKEVSFKV